MELIKNSASSDNLDSSKYHMHFTPSDQLIIAIGEDNVPKFKSVIVRLGIDHILGQRFDHGMNILNYAVDQESIEIVEFLSQILNPEQIKTLVNHRYAKEMKAIHQVMSLGELRLITILTE